MKDFGKFWSKDSYERPEGVLGFVDWYKWMYNSRLDINENIIKWVREKDDKIKSVADFGCGVSIGFSEAFSDKFFTGIDISKRNIDWCKDNYNNSKHVYMHKDFAKNPLSDKVDLVICNGTLENVLDINKAIESMVLSSKGWIYAAGCSGWHPNLRQHKYEWREEWGCNSSLISPSEVELVLKKLNCKKIQIFPFKRSAKMYETIIIAKVEGR
tara:strand:- start:756 stop:1394 length:639 start_codon:yes stop_codon:yes gene_type:complete